MKSKIFKHLAAYALSFLLILQYPIIALAESVENQEATGTVAIDRAAAGELTHTVTHKTNGLKFNITYPADVKCGQPTTFKFSLEDPNGAIAADSQVQYRIASLMVYDGTEYVSVYDVSWGQNGAYSPKESFDFTFYASGTYYIGFSAFYKKAEDGKYDTIEMRYASNIKLDIQDGNYPSVEEIVDRVAGECLANCSTDYEKALWLNDWLVENCVYDNSYTYCSAEGALARGVGTCEAYHRAYVMLLNKVNIPTGRITGNKHVWTAVNMEGKWYQVDTTWNDAGYEEPNVDLNRLYFGLNDDITTKVHSDHKPVAGYESNSLEQNYFIKSGEISKWSDPLVDTVKQHIAARDTSFNIDITRKASNAPDYASAYATVLYNLAAYTLMNTDWSSDDVDIQLSASYTPADNYSGTMACSVQYTDTGGTGDGSGGNTEGDGSGGGTEGDGSGGSTEGDGSGGGTEGDGSGGDSEGDGGDSSGDSEESADGDWKLNGVGWWFQYPDGTYPHNTWEKINGEWYWFNSSGYMAVGWQKINGSWYYMTGSGAMATGWQRINGSWYYLTGSGAMATGWQKVDETWYYLTGSGAMATGWQKINGSWYYLTGSGAMATGWQRINGSWYYLTGSGAMATGWQRINGSWYYLTGSGAMATGWQKVDGSWYYLTGSGAMATGWQKINGTWYYLNPNGSMAADTWIGEFYVNENGAWVA